MNKKVIIVVVVVLIAGAAVFGLTRNKKDTNDMDMNSSSSQNSSQNQSANSNNSSKTPESSNAVSIANFAFSPADITVKKGTTVTWTNNDSTVHTVQETDGKTGPKSDNLSNGDKYTFTYNEVGTFAYHCSIHASMTGTVTVTE